MLVGAMVAVLGTALALGQVPTASAASSSGLTVTPGGPLTDATDYITGLTDCGIGPVGMSVEATRTFVTDYCNSTTYLYDTSSDTPTLIVSMANGLTHGIAQLDGAYFGVASNNQSIVAPGIWEFSPRTLQLTRQITQDPCGDIRGLATDPTTADLILSGDCGIYRVKGLDTQNPFLTPIVAGNMDGIAVDPATGTVWAALNGDDRVNQYDLATGALVTSVPVSGGPDGIAFAAAGSPGGIGGNVFVNTNAGTIVMIDVHASNATTTVASGGGRGDFVTVGSDGYLYVTQPSSIIQVKPNIFLPVPGGPTGLPKAGDPVCNQSSGRVDDGWSYRATMTQNEGLVLQNLHYGPRLAARRISVPYIRAVGFGNAAVDGHLTVTPDTSDQELRSTLIAVGCTPSTGEVTATYRVTSQSANYSFLIEQNYRFAAYGADGKGSGKYCEATESAKCAKFWPTTTWAFEGPGALPPNAGLRVVQRFEYDPDGVNTSGAADVIADTVHGIGADDLAASGALKKEDEISSSSNQGPAIRSGSTVHWDNWHQTGRDSVGLPGPRSPGCAECVHMHWSWFGSVGPKLRASLNTIACGSPNCWSDGKPEILEGSRQVAVAGWAVAKTGESTPTNWESLINPPEQVRGQRLVFYWDVNTTANRVPTDGVVIAGRRYPVGDSYWPLLDNYNHGGDGGIFVDPADKFTTVANARTPNQATMTPDFRSAQVLHHGAPGSRAPTGYVVPVTVSIGGIPATGRFFLPALRGPYYLRVRSSGPAHLLNADPLYAVGDGGQPWVRLYDDTLNTRNGQWQMTNSTAPIMAFNRSSATALLVFDRPPNATDLSFELESAPDGRRYDSGGPYYEPATGSW
jgi:hypothetical protein